MPYRTIVIIATATVLGMANVTSDALAFRGGGARGGAADRGAMNRGASNRGASNRGAAYSAYRRPGVAAGVGAGAVGAAAGAAAAGQYYNSACGSPPYPPCQ
jgi:hypothetical protein